MEIKQLEPKDKVLTFFGEIKSTTVENTIKDIKQNAKGFDYIIVNDCSTDNTLEICRENHFNYLNLPINLGIGGAVQAGYRYAYYHGYVPDNTCCHGNRDRG